jgi:SNF2 family DNA or RNA helicase
LDSPKVVAHGFRYPLKPAQEHTLGWMMQQERGIEQTSVQKLRRPLGATDLAIEVEIARKCRPRGGILADQVGYGKTACMIALINQTVTNGLKAHALLPEEMKMFRNRFFTNATLIVTPRNLFAQWAGEIRKFTDADLAVVQIYDLTALKRMKIKDLVDADIVLVSFQFFFSNAYQRRVDKAVFEVDGIEIEAPMKVAIYESVADKKRVEVAIMHTGKDKAGHPKQMGPNAPLNAPKCNGKWNCRCGLVVSESRGWRRVGERLKKTVSGKTVMGPAPVYNKIKKDPKYFGKRCAVLENTVEKYLDECNVPAALAAPAGLERMYWKRIVFDEFHEVLKTTNGLAQASLRSLQARHHWGLTGTPDLESPASISAMASLLHTFSDPNSSRDGQNFLDNCVRQNRWDVNDLEIKDEIIDVKLTMQERALYKAKLQKWPKKIPSHEKEVLMHCSHFAPMGVGDLEGAVTAELDAKKFELRTAEGKLEEAQKGEARHKEAQNTKEALFTKLVDRARHCPRNDPGRTPNENHCIQVCAHATEEELRGLLDARVLKFDEFSALQQRVAYSGMCPKTPEGGLPPDRAICNNCEVCDRIKDFESGKKHWRKMVTEAEKRLEKAQKDLDFFEQAVEQAKNLEAGNEVEDCPICLGPIEKKTLGLLPCGHCFHSECIQDYLQGSPLCPTCRAPSASHQVTLSDELDIENEEPIDETRLKYGSKLAAVLSLLSRIHEESDDDKSIVFVQWRSISNKLFGALQECSLKVFSLHGTTKKREAILRQWESEPKGILLLSLDDDTSGMNLVAANHCLIVHPILTYTAAKAHRQEEQAVGRIVRQGQVKACFIYRFRTLNTIEETLFNSQQKKPAAE